MDNPSDIEVYKENPDLLLNLLRELIEFLENEEDKEETTAMEAQLQEISKAIEKLEKKSIFVPDVFRAEKTRLAAALGTQSEPMKTLSLISKELGEILMGLNGRIGIKSDITRTRKFTKRRSGLPRTNNQALRELIIDALRKKGGSAHLKKVLEYIKEQNDGNFLSGDIEWRESANEYVWENNVRWESSRMKREGIIEENSPKGIWELCEEYK